MPGPEPPVGSDFSSWVLSTICYIILKGHWGGGREGAWSYPRWDHVYSQQEDIFVTHVCTCKKGLQGKVGGGLLQGWRRAEITSREAGKCNVLAGKYHYEKGENRIIQ